MIDRDERRALPAGGHIGRAKIVHHRNADRFRQRVGIADLYGQPLSRPMQDCLAMEADNLDVFARDMILREEGSNGFGVRHGHGALGLADHARPRVALRQIDRLRKRLSQQAAFVVGVRTIAGRSERRHSLAIGFDQGDIDTIQ